MTEQFTSEQHDPQTASGVGVARRRRTVVRAVAAAGSLLAVAGVVAAVAAFAPDASSRADGAPLGRPAAQPADQPDQQPDGAPAGMCAAVLEVGGRTYTLDDAAVPDAGERTGPILGAGTIPACQDTPGVEGGEEQTVDVHAIDGVPVQRAVVSDGRVWVAVPAPSVSSIAAASAAPSLPPAGACAAEVRYAGRTYTQDGGTDADVRRGRPLGTGRIPRCDDGAGVVEAERVRVFAVRGTPGSEAVWVGGRPGYAWAAAR